MKNKTHRKKIRNSRNYKNRSRKYIYKKRNNLLYGGEMILANIKLPKLLTNLENTSQKEPIIDEIIDLLSEDIGQKINNLEDIYVIKYTYVNSQFDETSVFPYRKHISIPAIMMILNSSVDDATKIIIINRMKELGVINITDSIGRNALINEIDNERSSLIEYLIDTVGIDVNAKMTISEQEMEKYTNVTALWRSCQTGCSKCLTILLKKNADARVAAIDENGKSISPYEIAKHYNWQSCMTIIENVTMQDEISSLNSPFWLSQFGENVENLYDFKKNIYDEIISVNNNCDVVNSSLFPNNFTIKIPNPIIQSYFCIILLLVGILTKLLEKTCTILLKGGKAVQANTHINYKSDDIDILIIPGVNTTHTAHEIALEIGNFMVWLTTPLLIYSEHESKFKTKDIMREDGSIVKFSLKTNDGFIPISDIGYGELSPIQNNLYKNNIKIKTYSVANLQGLLNFPNTQTLLYEAIHYLVIYQYSTIIKKVQGRNIPFMFKSHRIINALLDDMVKNKKKNSKKKLLTEILTKIIIFNIKGNKDRIHILSDLTTFLLNPLVESTTVVYSKKK